jgi:hypothetical protein
MILSKAYKQAVIIPGALIILGYLIYACIYMALGLDKEEESD